MRKILSLFSITLVAIILLQNTTQAETRRREEQKVQEELDKARQELDLYRKQLDDTRIKRWQDKRNAVAAQEAFSEAWGDLKAEIDRLNQVKNQKEETSLRLQTQESEKDHEVAEQENRLKQFGLQIQEKLNELEQATENGFPIRTVEKLGQISNFKQSLAQGNNASGSALEKLFTLSLQDFQDGESRELVRDKLAVEGLATQTGSAGGRVNAAAQAKRVAGYKIRLGQVYAAFISTESEDVAILGKTGRIDSKSWEWIEDLPEGTRKNLRQAVEGLAGNQDISFLPIDVLLIKANGEGFTSKSSNTFWKSVQHEFDGGGWVMWPIMTLAGLGILIIFEKTFVFLRMDQNAQKLADEVFALSAAGRIPQAMDLCRKAKGSVSRVLLSILENSNDSREEAESHAHEVMLHEAPILERRITTMNILAAASPLVGLLGTVTGMVRLFDVITVHGTGNPKLMAGGISEALIATKWGLGVAIPMLLSYNWLDTWSGKIIGNMEKYSARLLNLLFVRNRKKVEENVF